MHPTIIGSILLACTLCVAACGKPAAKQPKPAPPSAAVAPAQPSAEEASEFLALIDRDPIADSDIQSFLTISESEDALTRMRAFNTPESDFASGKVATPEKEIARYIELSNGLRRFAKATIDRGNTLRDAGDIEGARRHYRAVLTAADANSWEGVALIGKKTAEAMRHAAEAELAKLPQK